MASTKVAVVVGVGPGLGAAVAKRFAREGFTVGLLARNTEHLAPVQREVERAGGVAVSLAADVTDAASLAHALSALRDAHGAPEVLVYNAGAFLPGGVLEVTPEQFTQCWQANCFGAFVAAQQVLPAMLEKGRGTIVFSGATASLRGSARFSCLAVGKFGLRALAQSMAREFGPRGIHVAHVVIDGQIDTPRVRSMSPDRAANTMLAPDAIAESYWQLHAQDASAWTLELDVRPSVERF